MKVVDNGFRDDHHNDTPIPEMIDRIENVLEGGKAEPVQDGKVRVQVRNDGIFLIVTPPQGGKKVDFLTVKMLLDSKGIVDYDLQKINEALENQNGEPVLIAERRPELDRDGEVTITTNDSGMVAYIEVRPALGGKPITRQMIEEALQAKGITYGIKQEAIEQAVAAKTPVSLVIAEGRPPVDGTDATIVFKFNINPEATPVELADGTVDYRNLDLIQNVKAGDVLAERIPAVPGLPGINVYGRTIKPKGGKNVRLPRGTNTEISEEDENLLIAKEAGQAVYKDNKVHVFPVCTINQDVDFQTGNIDFVGSVVINGGIRSGFSVHASGNVEIRGPVEAATIIADGDVVLHRGMQGANTGQIVAKSVTAKFLEHCKVVAREDIIVSDAIMYCDLEAGRSIKTLGKIGRLVGGVALAGEEIQARSIGTKLGMKTEVSVGVNPEIRRELSNLSEQLTQKQRQLKMVSNGLTRFKMELQAGKTFTPEEHQRIQKLIEAHQLLKDEVATIEQKKADLEAVVANSKRGRIVAYDRVYPGVKVSIGKDSLVVPDEIQNVCFYLRDNELAQGSAV